MTTFYRSGYLRTSKYGVVHWVDGHHVSRDDWERSGYGLGLVGFRQHLADVRAGASVASTYIIPNANCPVCDSAVFVYQNQHGSRVYFDDLGPPWPKHPCTDSAEYCSNASSELAVITPSVRSSQEISIIRQCMQFSGVDPEAAFVTAYALSPWTPFSIVWRYSHGRESILILSRLNEGKSLRLFVWVEGLPRYVTVGSVVHYYRHWISFFDPHRSEVTELEVSLLRMSAFVDALINVRSR